MGPAVAGLHGANFTLQVQNASRAYLNLNLQRQLDCEMGGAIQCSEMLDRQCFFIFLLF